MWKLFNKKSGAAPQNAGQPGAKEKTAEKGAAVSAEIKKKSAAKAIPHTNKAAGYGVLGSPLVTEKSAYGSEHNVYIFKVSKKANKVSIAKAFATMYGVRPLAVRTSIAPTRVRRTKSGTGTEPTWKKAHIRVPKGTVIDLYEGV